MKNLKLLSIVVFSMLNFGAYAQDENALTREEVASITEAAANEIQQAVSDYVAPMWEERVLENNGLSMPFWYDINGKKPANGYPMYISMHGGGGAPAEVNDQQWENQKRLYGTVPGIYWVPRAPTNTWNLWHQDYMEPFLMLAITYAVVELGADPNRIYLTGYSAGGDGTFNLAPRLADWWAAAAMMAGHPGDAVAENLRNLPFAIYMGGKDAAYNRNGLAAEWGEKLDALQAADPEGYIHRVVIYPELGHWMNNKDKEAIGWMAQYTRNPYPDKVIWVMDDVRNGFKYNLETYESEPGWQLIVSYDKAANRATIEKSDYKTLTIWLNDEILDLDREVEVVYNGEQIFKGKVARTKDNIYRNMEMRVDKAFAFPAKVDIELN